MRICLVSAPTLAEFEDLSRIGDEVGDRVPLGVLALASVVEQQGPCPDVVDVDALYADFRRTSGRREGFAARAASELAARNAEVYGFGTICGSYPLTLRIAAALRAHRPGCAIVLGGPQASATARETLAAFPAVDVVARGEGEAVLPVLLDALASGRDLSSVAGVTYRRRGAISESADAPLVEDLDLLPAPAYRLLPGLRRITSLPVEAGRGCPFSCTFCSTSRFFGRSFRLKSPRRIVDEMLALRRAYGTRSFDLVHDNFTVDRRRVVAFCGAVSSCGETLHWSCSSRTDMLDDALVDLMAAAGCRGIFFGVESGAPAVQRAIGKRLRLDEVRDRLRRVSRRRIPASASFIVGFPEETSEDLRGTVDLFVDALRLDRVDAQMSLLSPLAGTPIHARHRHELVRDELVSDMAFQGDALDAADAALVDRHPDLFSSYWSVPSRWLDRRELWELRAFLLGARSELRWLLVGAAQVGGGGMEVFRQFRSWRARRALRSPRAIVRYHRSAAFRGDLVRFVGEELARRCEPRGDALRGLAAYYASLGEAPAPRNGRPSIGPNLAPDVRLARLDCDGAALFRCLRQGGDLGAVPRRASSLVTRLRRGRSRVLRVTEQAADLLELCDGTRDERAIARAFAARHRDIDGVPAAVACAFGLAMLRRKGFLAFPAQEGSITEAAASSASPGAPSCRRAAGGRDRRPSSARAGDR